MNEDGWVKTVWKYWLKRLALERPLLADASSKINGRRDGSRFGKTSNVSVDGRI